MGAESVSPRWLVVVRRDRPDVYALLRRSFEPDRRVSVIMDRRRANRRAESAWAGGERRRRQRRQPLREPDQATWEIAGASWAACET
jgi:hypothetical protein